MNKTFEVKRKRTKGHIWTSSQFTPQNNYESMSSADRGRDDFNGSWLIIKHTEREDEAINVSFAETENDFISTP